ncbi:MAG: response regulator [Anaerolineae bacterium]|jgi:CheY-like chemotaxis protein|nr:response regulator [Anaerolineae bacterium]
MTTRKAFIIEDNVELGYIYKTVLEAVDFTVENITDGKEALRRFETEVPDLIILDMNLPQVSGHYIYQKLRADERFKQMPIVIATANELVATALRHQLGERDFLLVKPISPNKLRALGKELHQMVDRDQS